MYVRGKKWYGHMEALSDNGLWCESVAPDNTFCCTLSPGHEGPHRAGVDISTWVAEWDDDRTTDSVTGRPMLMATKDFFSSIGL